MPTNSPVAVSFLEKSWLASAMPKSAIFTWPFGVIIRLPGLMSRCTTPLSCAVASPWAVWFISFSAFSTLSWPSRLSSEDSDSPSMNSIAKNGCPVLSSVPMKYTWMMYGSFSTAIERASRRKRSTRLVSCASDGDSSLIATKRLSAGS